MIDALNNIQGLLIVLFILCHLPIYLFLYTIIRQLGYISMEYEERDNVNKVALGNIVRNTLDINNEDN